jgi:cohesin loading factor subunit SCC2
MEKERVDDLVDQFTTLLEDIFEAEDAFNPDAEIPTEGSLAFFSLDSLREDKPWLSREGHRKLDVHLRRLGKTIAAREGLRIDTGDLMRITGICERAVKAAEMIDLKNIDDEEDAEREWVVGKLGKVENAILASNVIMLLISGRGTDQPVSPFLTLLIQIYSEETLKSIVEVLRIFLDSLFHWIASATSDHNASDTLHIAMNCNKQIVNLLYSSIALLSQFETQLAETVSQESIINVLQFVAVEAIFLENLAKDKEAVISNQGIESLRVISMGILRQVFASYPDQRSFILDEVLTSLAKLPANRQNARHFKLLDGKSIQLVSALMMKLVQACGACFNIRNIDSASMENRLAENDEDAEHTQRQRRINLYADEWANASKAAHQSANYIVTYLTNRALQTSKTTPTDSPFKALLDIFTEDFLTVLAAPEWPAAELLLRSLVKNLYACIDGDNHGAQVKNVALDAVGQIAAKIRSIRKKLAAQLASRMDEETDAISLIATIADYSTGSALTMQEMTNLQETYRLIWAKSESGMRDALRFQVCGWANFLLSTDKQDDEEETTTTRRSMPLIEELASIARAGKAQFDSLSLPSDVEVSLACTALLTRSHLFQSYDHMLSRILRSMSEKQPTFRTKALRALGQIILADPDILSLTNVQQQVALRVSDPSPAVREAAIELVSKHIASDPVLGQKYYEVMRGRINDAGLGVRKRVIKLLKDIYFKSVDQAMQAEIAASILSRIADDEHSVRVRSTLIFELIFRILQSRRWRNCGLCPLVRILI